MGDVFGVGVAGVLSDAGVGVLLPGVGVLAGVSELQATKLNAITDTSKIAVIAFKTVCFRMCFHLILNF